MGKDELLEVVRDGGRLFEALFEQRSLGVAKICSITGRFIKVNDRYANLLGLTPSDLLETDFQSITHADDLAGDMSRMEDLKSGAIETFQIDKRYWHRDGALIWVRLTVLPLWPRQATPDYHLAIVEDITPRVNSATELRENRRRLQTLMNNLPGMAYRCRNDEDWTMEFVSEGVKALTGYSAEDIRNNSVIAYADLILREDQDAVWDQVQTALAEKRPFRLDYRIRCRDGSIHHVWEKGVGVYDQDGELIFLEGFITDVSDWVLAEAERARLQSQVLHGQKLESLGLLAGGIAHDFNNLLTAILGFAEMARMESSIESARRMLDEVIGGALRAAQLTEQMLAYSGKAPFRKTSLCVKELVQDLTPLLRATIPKNCVIEHAFTPGEIAVDADSSQIQQVVMNLVINGAEALNGKNGCVSVSAVSVAVGENDVIDQVSEKPLAAGRYVRLSVADDGIGMDEATMERIFDPFFTTKFTGRGLGLAAIGGIARGHGGCVTFQSKLGEGAEFHVYLPVAVETSLSETDDRSGGAPNPVPASGKILIVDDEPAIRKLAGRILTRSGFVVEFAADGLEGLTRFREAPEEFCAVLMDLTMPEMNGADAARAIRDIREDVPIVLASGYTDQNAGDGLLPRPPARFIPKPFTPNGLDVAFQELFAGNVSASSHLSDLGSDRPF